MAEFVLLDSSAAIRLLYVQDDGHADVLTRVRRCRRGLAGHAAFETFSVVTRVPPPRRLSPATASDVLRRSFPETRFASGSAQAELFGALAERGIAGGAIYDALVALAATEHDATLISFDRRAADTYGKVGARVEILNGL